MGLAVPVMANARTSHAKHKASRTLHMTLKYNRTAAKPRNHKVAAFSTLPPQAVLQMQNYNCAVTIGTGTNGNTQTNTHTHDSTEFSITYTSSAGTFMSVTSNCIGMVPAGHTVPSTTVTHVLTSCQQFDPQNPSGPTIQGSGITTTYPDGLYSETCNTPAEPV